MDKLAADGAHKRSKRGLQSGYPDSVSL
jgi:hypothetical protein